MAGKGFVCLLLAQTVLWLNPLWARDGSAEEVAAIKAQFIKAPPTIDGKLDDPAWQTPPVVLPEWLSYNPLYGDKINQRTDIWIAYDSANLYFAFRCLDHEPEKIKTSVSRRDTIFSDDWIGFSLDAMGNGQNAYEMMVNPSGVQADLRYSTNSGESSTPDWVWESAGGRTEQGDNVEIRLPFKSIRFKSGNEVRMGVIFFRKVSRLGMSVSWPHLPPGKSWLTLHAPLLLREVEQPAMLEAIPSVTYGLTQDRSSLQQWNEPNSKFDAGLTVKYGLTSAATLDGTINPDFSQVESDAFQVEVNQRYPVFYSEKRPFFMEGMGNFDLAGGDGGDSNMITAVHTRRIVDPLFGLKLTGTVGRFTFSTLSASDRSYESEDTADTSQDEGKEFNVGRALFSLGEGSYAGALFADTEFAGGYNRVFAVDASVQSGKNQRWSATAIRTGTLSPGEKGDRKSGMAGQIGYLYNSKRFIVETQVEHYDKDFHMDTAFYNRTGFTSGWLYSSVNFYPDAKKYPWLKRWNPFIWTRHGKDRVQGGTETVGVFGIQTSWTRQGFFRIDGFVGREPWAGRDFHFRRFRAFGNTQLTRWLRLKGYFHTGSSIYYDPVQPFTGHSKSRSIDVLVQPNDRFSQNIVYNRVTFDSIQTGNRVYSVDIVNTRTMYQFNRHFFLRAILQYDSSRKRILGDFVASYELVPGTVMHAGYGSLFEKREWDLEEQQARPGSQEFLNSQRTLFFKFSYLFRL